ncbi:histidine phosphatase family protein [Nocardia sp. NBC_01009]|uniref:histidine phosphatase family protein n=1 Tax=Nocardia sp. NBC_01009 TaxID=2975996 RepID=UPI00386E678F|nr:histidine phosphatase family protein [Nocardia sp. NBC_01009]
MQLILVRHAQPLRVMNADGPADPELATVGLEQAERVPAALSHHRISRVVSSPQRRARDTAAPTAAKLGLDVEIVDDLAEYDRDLPAYIPIEDAKIEFRAAYERIKAGQLPEQVDADAFRTRVRDAVLEIASATDAADTVAVFAHGGVINVILQEVLDLARPLTFPIDYCSITRILYSRTGRRTAATVNENGHVWDLLPRNIAARD